MMTTSIADICVLWRVWRIIGLLAISAALASCSLVRLAYNQAPDALYWWLDGYFDFSEAQSLRVREGLDTVQKWHRKSELPAYADMLQKMQRLAPGEITGEQVCGLLSEARERGLALSQALEPTIVAVAPLLTREQITHLERQLAKRNRKWREEWLEGSPRERTDHRVKQAVERAERFYGRLEPAQVAVARAMVEASPFDAQQTYRETQRRQHDAVRTLRQLQTQQPGPLATQAMMRTLFERSLESPDAAYRSYLEALTRTGCAGVATLHNSTTPTQRARAVDTLKAYEADARALAAQ
jgi:Family of unknown function (DUF6279)